MVNQLVRETSPYLKQHQDNPVNWYPWCEKALEQAKQQNKPIFLSIGYSACHWCHVMAHESFEDLQTAEMLNDNFINIKVDREERPDLDDIYMQAVVLLTGQGGWPLSVFLTPDLKPFYGGTYFPPVPRYRMPSFRQILTTVINAWNNNQDAITHNAQALTEAVQTQHTHKINTANTIDLSRAVKTLLKNYDWVNGGWGNAPKFPQPMVIDFLIQRGIGGDEKVSKLVSHVLERMSRGGMCDLVGGGFHRYSTDTKWLVPHFEKMLYDNAQLAQVYLHGFFLTGCELFKNVAIDTLNFIQNEMTQPEGGFYASLDADTSEGEGRYYAWERKTLQDELTKEQFQLLDQVISLNDSGNFDTGLNILQYQSSFIDLAKMMNRSIAELHSQMQPIYLQLRKIRSKRIPPHKDKKIITLWNALTIQAFAQAGLLLKHDCFIKTAKEAANFILNHLQERPGHLYHTWSQGQGGQPATLADYAGMILALHSLYQIDFEPNYYHLMHSFFQTMQAKFSTGDGLYYDAAADISSLIIRPQNLQDNATPSGNALAAHCHWLMMNYEQDPDHADRISKMIKSHNDSPTQYPTSFGYWLQMVDRINQTSQQVALISKNGLESLEPFLEVYRNKFRPYSVIAAQYAGNEKQSPKLLTDHKSIKGRPSAFVCSAFTCQHPVNDPVEFASQLDKILPH